MPFFQAKLHINSYTDTQEQESIFQDSPDTIDQRPSIGSRSQAPCISLISFTVTPNAPAIASPGRSCRLGPGSNSCSTPRGSCGSSSAGAIFQATVRAPVDCRGNLAFAQDVLSSTRRRTKIDNSEDCITMASPHHDGGPPWKNCQVDVSSSGDHVIESDDCPNIGLGDDMRAASVSESFKTFLMWKPDGSTSRVPFAAATWGWGASAIRNPNASGNCAALWTMSNPSTTQGNGTLSSDRPVSSPLRRDVDFQPCR